MDTDATFKKYQKFVESKSHLVTTHPVRLVVNKNAKTKNAEAHTLKYTRPTHYSIVFSGGYYRYHKNNPYVIKNVILHELAHIIHPYNHDAGFRHVAQILGAPPEYQN